MPRAKGVTRGVPKTDPNAGRKYYLPAEAPWGGFINLKIVEQERSDFDAWVSSDETQIWTGVAAALRDGLQVSLKWDAASDCYTASYLGKGVSNDDSRYCLVARGATWHEALALVEYKHTVLMDGAWDDYKPSTGRLDKFG